MILEIVSFLLYNFNRIGDHMNKKRNGFTLVELLVCFVLITIVTISLFKIKPHI